MVDLRPGFPEMMQRLRAVPGVIAALLSAAVLLVLAGCGIGSSTPPPVEKAKIVVPDAGASVSSSSSVNISPDVTQEVLTPKVPIPKQDILLQTINTNLDLDQSEEQILVLKDKDNADSPIQIAVADFDSVRNEYVLSWEHATLATNIRTFDVTTEDLIGDHIPEIICTGMNNKGEQTLDVFRKTHPPTGVNLYYTEIFKTAVTGKIEIEQHERSQAYKLGQANGTSFAIVTYEQNATSGHIGDLVKTTYNWKYQTNTYVQTDQQKIPGKQIEDQRLAALYSSGAAAFEKFLDGPWFKASSDPNGGTASDPTASDAVTGTTLLFFDPTARQITFYSGDVMEVYSWDNSYRTLYNGLVISAYNELVQYIKSQISISVSSIDRIVVYSPEEWQGTYQRLTESMQRTLIRRPDQNAPPLPKLSGEYTTSSGAKLIFNQPDFTLVEGERKQVGGFALYYFGTPVLVLHFLKVGGIVEGSKSYSVSFREEKSPTEIVRSLTLTPGVVGIRGFTPNGDLPIRYQQTEVLQSSGKGQQKP